MFGKNVIYKGVELDWWISFLTWDANGMCYGWSRNSVASNDGDDECWYSAYGDTTSRTKYIKELDVDPFTDDSWRDYKIVF